MSLSQKMNNRPDNIEYRYIELVNYAFFPLPLQEIREIKELNEEKRKSARRREFIMAELLETERSYVKDLETAVHCFLLPMKSDPDSVPTPLKNQDGIIFGNVEEILQFHKTIFLKALEKYEAMPEDVGHAFVTWAPKFDSYVKYCTNKPHSTQVLVQVYTPYIPS